MNKHTLNYHTRLHDWYRQHSIQQEKQQQQQSLQQELGGGLGHGGVHASTHSLAVVAPACGTSADHAAAGAHLSQDKLYFISQWCSEVNKTLFRVKRKESPPLYRRCRLGGASSKDLTASGVGLSGGKSTADPRRVRSAEVFTLAGHWSKQPKPTLSGGELLPTSSQVKIGGGRGGDYNKRDPANHVGDSRGVDLCVRNSKDKDCQHEPPMARINHDSLNVRSNAFILRHQYNNGRYSRPGGAGLVNAVLSPRSSATQLEKLDKEQRGLLYNNDLPSARRRAKSAAMHSTRRRLHGMDEEQDEEEEEEGERDYSRTNGAAKSGEESHSSHKELERLNNAKNEEDSLRQQNLRPVSSSHKSRVASSKTKASSMSDLYEEGEDGNSTLVRKIINVVVTDEANVNPQLCNDCNQNLADKAAKEAAENEETVRKILNEELERTKRLAETEKQIDQEITKAEVNVKHVTNRLTEDSLHYSSEREALRLVNANKSFTIPNNFDDLEDERNISFEDINGDEDKMSEEVSDDAHSDINSDASSPIKVTAARRKSLVRIKIENVDDENNASKEESNTENQQPAVVKDSRSLSVSESDQMEAPDVEMLKIIQERRGSRRKSLSFGIKPTVGNLSTSNSLLHVLSIDDCKMSMRYSPHKILEEHEVTDSLMLPLSQILTSEYLNSSPENSPRETGKGNKYNDNNNNNNGVVDSARAYGSKAAMRVSGQDSGMTTLRTASAHHATKTNKMQYRILTDPNDPGYYKNMRPQSACLAKAFNTLINDRTIMQRLGDRPGTASNANNGRNRIRSASTKSLTASATGSKPAYEGPVYQRANTVLKKQMEALLQRHSSQMKARYERLKNNPTPHKKPLVLTLGVPSLNEEVSEKSLSLESLPLVKKGILKDSRESLLKGSSESLNK
ncbi:uncharacterized protein LOC106013173 [Aplysia californica]|uniref:Uncharacterized protein LOC106013173 n=1 Tax=Aplysia californica TaxID=6500 RepID=A0ABM1A9X8_APLCA|nr:uncharacterized protein LOC106013173 [Aplysia californica]